MSKLRRNHFVPDFQLKGFADRQGMIWVYDRKTKQYRHQSTKDTALIKNYYRIEKKGKYSMEIEQLLSQIEGLASAVFKKFEIGEQISDEEKANVAMFVALQHTRVPTYEKVSNEMQEKMITKLYKLQFNSVDATREELRKLEKITGEKVSDDNAQEIFDIIQNDKLKVGIPRQNTIRSMLQLASHIAIYLVQMDWMLIRAPKNTAFITTDNPFIILPPEKPVPFWGVGIITPGAKKGLPISPNLCLFMGDKGSKFVTGIISRDKVRGLNISFARTSDRFVFARDKDHLVDIVRKSHVDEIPIERERVVIG